MRGFIISIILSVVIVFPGCKKELNKAPTNEFDIDLFEENILQQVGNQPIGWAYVINQDGQYYSGNAFGSAQTSSNGNVAFSEDKIINVASISKFFTAIAVLQLLERRNLSIDSKISQWLPPTWLQGIGVNNLSFRDLLTHRSGLQSTNTNFSQTLCYNCLSQVINQGVTNNKSVRNYLNANYALFRVLILSLWRGLPNDGPSANILLTAANTESKYIEYMQKYIFDPAGVNNATCSPEAGSGGTLYYAINDDSNNISGERYTDWTTISGGGGYFLSALDVAKVLAFYEHTETLLSDEIKNDMKDNRIGYEPWDPSRETHGFYYGKNGAILNPSSGQGMLSEIVIFPLNGVEIVVLMNTQGVTFSNGNNIRQMMYDAYNDAW